MIVGVPRETYPGERRVALVPIVIPNLAKAGMEVIVEASAGVAAAIAMTPQIMVDASKRSRVVINFICRPFWRP